MINPKSRFQLFVGLAIVALYAVSSNIVLYSSDAVMLAGGSSPEESIHKYYNWTTAILQPWHWVVYPIFESFRLTAPHSSVVSSIVSGIAAALILSLIFIYLFRRRPFLCMPLVVIFGSLSIAGIFIALGDFSEFREYRRNQTNEDA
jgi:hypothetical protein